MECSKLLETLGKSASYGVTPSGFIGEKQPSPLTYYALPDLRNLSPSESESAINRSHELNKGLTRGLGPGQLQSLVTSVKNDHYEKMLSNEFKNMMLARLKGQSYGRPTQYANEAANVAAYKLTH